MDLQDVSFIVTDTETTGSQADKHRIVEIGAVKVKGGEVVDTYQQLVHPGVAIPYQITRLTGITNSMVYGKPPIEHILDDFLDFLDEGVFVAHNARFDRRFINAELRRAGRKAMPNKSLCTARLARRLLAGLKSKGLTSLAEFYNIKIVNRHRAFDDAAATATILIRLLDKIRMQTESPTLADVLMLQMKPYRSARAPSPNVARIRDEVLGDLPQRAGVYFMHDAAGEIIYIGKAKNLKSRVRSYFNAVEGHPPKTRELLKTVRDVSWQETGNELSALLTESRLIKHHQPRFNRALKKYGRKPFIKLETNSDYPSVSSTRQLIDDGAEYYGPVHGGRYARFLVDIINKVYRLRECDSATLALGRPCFYHDIDRCHAPCLGGIDQLYSDEVDRVRAFLKGEDDTVVHRLESKMEAAAAKLQFEEARQYRDWIVRLRNLHAKQRMVAADVMDHNAAIVLAEDNSPYIQIFFIRFGRLATSISIDPSTQEFARGKIVQLLDSIFVEGQPRPSRYRKEEVDEVRILTSWLFANRNDTSSIHWSAGMHVEGFADKIMNEVIRTINPVSLASKMHSNT